VDHAPGVGVGDGLGNLLEDAQEPWHIFGRMFAIGQERGQSTSLHELHGKVRPPVGERTQLIDGDNAGVLQLTGDLRLLDEPSDQFWTITVHVQKHLDRQVAAEVGVAPLEHRSHAAASDLAEKLQPRGPIGWVGHFG
jgi:hypothetical protein